MTVARYEMVHIEVGGRPWEMTGMTVALISSMPLSYCLIEIAAAIRDGIISVQVILSIYHYVMKGRS